MKATPEGWPRVTSALFYDDAATAIDWLCRVFGFEVRLKVEGENGSIEHSELTFGDDGLVMVGEATKRDYCASPRSVQGRNTQGLCVIVDDADEHCQRARAAGAKITMEPETHDYGEDYWVDRIYQAEDPEGHRFWFMQRLRGPGEAK